MPIHYPFYLMLIDYDNKVRISENKKLLEKCLNIILTKLK